MWRSSAVRFRGRQSVLVGVDGSASAEEALAWAAAEAAYRHRPLQIVHAATWPTIGNPLDMTATAPVGDGILDASRWSLGEAENHARHLAPDITVSAELFVASAAPTLLSQAQDAELVVVGSRGLGGFRGLLVGSVSATLAAHAPCPVIVVRPQTDGTALHGHPAQILIDESLGAELVVVGSHGHGGFAGMLLGSVSQAVLHHGPSPVAVVHTSRSGAADGGIMTTGTVAS